MTNAEIVCDDEPDIPVLVEPVGRQPRAERRRGSTLNLAPEIIAGAVLVASRSTGFGVYRAAASSLGTATAAVGRSLPFAVYTGMSTAIKTATGSKAWGTLAASALSKIVRSLI